MKAGRKALHKEAGHSHASDPESVKPVATVASASPTGGGSTLFSKL